VNKVSVVVPNLNGADHLLACLDSLTHQSLKPHIVVVDNGSSDDSIELLVKKYPSVEVIARDKNYGFTGGVNPGLQVAIKRDDEFVALLNNDAVAHKNWLEALVKSFSNKPQLGIVTSKIINDSGEYLDSTGEYYTTWGLSYPRGRREADLDKYDGNTDIFGASGGASLYRVAMLKEVGLFDDDFFAYYEDVDLSFRARLAGWEVAFAPEAIVHHHIGSTSARIPGFATYQTMKNLPLLFYKNVPLKLMPIMLPRFKLVYIGLLVSAVGHGEGWLALKGVGRAILLLPKKLVQRHKIQAKRKLTPDQVSALLVHDLPPNARKIRALRGWWWKITKRQNG